MSETNVQLFPGVFRSTVGGANPGFFLHSDGRVGIGNTAPTTRPVWSSDDNDRNKLNVSGHTHIEGNLNVTGYVYGDGSNLTGTSLPWQQSAPNVATDIKYEGGNVGIGGDAGTVPLKVHGTVQTTGSIDAGAEVYCQNWIRTRGDSGHYWESTSNGHGWHIYPKGRNDMYFRSGSGNGSIAGTVENSTVRGYVHWTTSNEIGFLNSSRSWSLRMDNSKNATVYGSVYLSGTGQGIRSATGNYGTVQSIGGGNNGWEGFSIDGRYVFMSADNNSCGIYNDIDNEWMIQCYRNSGVDMFHDGALRFYTGAPNVFSSAGLRVYGVEATTNYSNSGSDWWTNGGSIQADPPNLNFGLYLNNAIRAPTYVAFSDRRIKKDFVELDDTLALNTLRKLKPTTYGYIDKTRNTRDRVIGFIAQEVAEVLPDAVSLQENVIPNIQCEASVKKVGEKEFELTLREPHVVTVGTKLELRLPEMEHIEASVQSVTNDTTFTIIPGEHYPLKDDVNRIWVYGEEINDFHHLDKNAIFTVATAALQEVDRRQVAHDERIAALETRNAELEVSLQNVLTRLETLEAARV